MEYMPLFSLYAVLVPLLSAALLLLLLYGVVRVAVNHGHRDHYRWLQRQQPSAPQDE